MKKKNILIIAIIVLLIILLFPIPMKLKDGGTVEYKALLYSVTKYHKLAPENSEKEYIDGIGIKILGKEIYNNIDKDVVKSNNIEEQNKTSKLAQMYIDMIEYIMGKDQGLHGNIKFLAIDFSNFRRPLTETEKAEKYNMPNFNTKEEQEKWERMIKSKPIEDKTKQEIVEYLKEKYSNIEIKQNTLEELIEQGLATKDQGIENGILIYVSSFPEIMEENKAKLELTKYRGPLAAYFIEYEMQYKNNEWQLKSISEAIS